MSFDPEGIWSINSSTANQLAETEFGNGGQLGTGGTATSLQLGLDDAWTLSRFEDLVVSITRLLPDNVTTETIGVPVKYLNGLGQAAARSDLNFDGTVDAADWSLFYPNYLKNLSALTVAQAANLGDLNGNKTNDYTDFLLFRGDFDAANGAGAFAAMIAAPEPSSVLMGLLAGCAAMGARRKLAPQSRRSQQRHEPAQGSKASRR
jgi:hypothetical protein